MATPAGGCIHDLVTVRVTLPKVPYRGCWYDVRAQVRHQARALDGSNWSLTASYTATANNVRLGGSSSPRASGRAGGVSAISTYTDFVPATVTGSVRWLGFDGCAAGGMKNYPSLRMQLFLFGHGFEGRELRRSPEGVAPTDSGTSASKGGRRSRRSMCPSRRHQRAASSPPAPA